MYKLIISPEARKELKKIKKVHQTTIKLVLQEIKEDPFIGKPLTRELTGRFSCRVGVYRIIYKINKIDRAVYILTAGHRAMIYSQKSFAH